MVPVVKRSLSLPADLFAALEQEAKVDGVDVSAVITEAARHWVVVRQGLRAVREWEAEHGSLTEQELANADVLLDTRPLAGG